MARVASTLTALTTPELAWSIRNARNGFSKLVRQAIDFGPQTVTIRGKPVVVVISIEEYERLLARNQAIDAQVLSSV
jgi:prevent-host-death family protein